MGAWDYSIIAAYFGLVIYIGAKARKHVRTSDDFFLSGRSLPLWMTSIAFMAANLGSFELMGFAANAVKYGMFTAQLYWWGSVPAMVFAGLVMVPAFYSAKVRSVPEFLRVRFDEKCRALNAIAFSFLTIFTSGLSLYGLAVVFHVLFRWNLDVCIVLSATTVLLYVMSGGLRASIYTEILQFVLMVGGIFPLSYMVLRQHGGIAGLLKRTPENMRHLWKPVLEPATSAWGEGLFPLIVGLGLASAAYWSTDFLVIQRALAAKDIDTAKKTPLYAAFPKMFFPILTVVPGLGALIAIPHRIEGNYNLTLPLMFLEYYPSGLLGLGVTALLASFMAGMAGNVTAFNTVWTYDIYQAYFAPNRPDKHYLRVGRLVTVAGILISVMTAYSARAFPNIFDYWALLSVIFVGAPFGTFVLGAFTSGIGGTAAFAGMLAGIVTTLAHYYASKWGYLHYGSALAMDFTGAAYGFFANVGLTVLVTWARRTRIKLLPPPWRTAAVPGTGRIAPGIVALAALALMVVLNVLFR
jgi:SSS family solute:Na+ symporter